MEAGGDLMDRTVQKHDDKMRQGLHRTSSAHIQADRTNVLGQDDSIDDGEPLIWQTFTPQKREQMFDAFPAEGSLEAVDSAHEYVI